MVHIATEADMKKFGLNLGGLLRGSEVFELVGDVGAGKTTLVKGIGEGLQVDDDVQSPSFTLSRVYGARDSLELHHYDLYRLQDAGVLGYEFAESVDDPKVVTIVEWGETLGDVLPGERVVIKIDYTPDGEGREISASVPDKYAYLGEALS